jgi:signal transduction histidine kinase
LTELGIVLGEQTKVKVEVVAAPDVPLSAAVELAAYRIAAEAISNAVRHSGARSVQVMLEVESDEVALTVVDDGTGIRAGASEGVGLGSMRERAIELGGALHVTSGKDGTRVEAHLPRHEDGGWS